MKRRILAAMMPMALAGCVAIAVGAYDPISYQQFTALKAEVAALYDTFGSKRLDEKAVGAVRLKMAQVCEYEKGKGESNGETIAQMEKVRQMFERHVRDREENGAWNETHLRNQKEIVAEAFDIVIRTERSKNERR